MPLQKYEDFLELSVKQFVRDRTLSMLEGGGGFLLGS